ncbi:MAG: aminotransferase class I/II-fold pyridoxal phosphate-dependent enzyme [Gemmatimonadetes bacterium]|nr:aminotransferase class I/II-fold pyridoxal phosphate-dependent enzyme [Gemmatimonadota bacterium]
MIDLRSDTVTLPTPAMREAMARAPVGDDVYHEDPTVLELEARVAELLGKEDAVYVPSGTMSNQIALRTHTEPGDMAIMDASAHMVINEGGGAAALSGVTIVRMSGRAGIYGAADVEAALEVPHPFNPPNHAPRARIVCVENTHNSGGGTIWPLATLTAVAETARRNGLALHMDGARLWHASAASGVPERTFAEFFDTVSVCFSKGLGAPVGSALSGSRALITRARRFKQMYGGGFRQAGILAAGALHALDHHRDRLGEDVTHARLFAEALAGMDGVAVDLATVQSNIVRFEVTPMTAGDFVDRCRDRGVHMLPGGHHGVRAVMHLGVERADVDTALGVIRDVLGADEGP